MTKVPFLIAVVLLFFVSCKTAEQIQRENLIQTMAVQMVQVQKMMADNTVKQQDIEERLNGINGNIEESKQKKSSTKRNELNQLNSEIELLKEEIKAVQRTSVQNRADLNEQKKLLKRILDTLSEMSGKKSKPSYETALALYKKRKYKTARNYFVRALKIKRLAHHKKARSYHNLGMIDFMAKKYISARSSFSSLILKYPKSSLAPNGLLYLAKSLNRTKQKDAARDTLNELIKRYPKSRKVKEAKKLLKKI